MASSTLSISIKSIPPEILHFIFEYCVQQVHTRYGFIDGRPYHSCDRRCLMDWVQITHVCSRWRTVSLAHRPLWTKIIFFHLQWAKTMIERSKGLPLAVTVLVSSTETEVQEEVAAILLKNMERIQMLDFSGNHGVANQLKNYLELSHDVERQVDLASLSLDSISSFRAPLSPLHNIKRLHLLGCPLMVEGSEMLILDGLMTLEELFLEGCFFMTALENVEIHMPRLTHLHLVDSMNKCLQFLSIFKQTRPLVYLGIEGDIFPPNMDNISVLDNVEIVDRTGKTNRPTRLVGHHCAVDIGLRKGVLDDESSISLSTWPKDAVSPSDVIAFARQNMISPLDSEDHRRLKRQEALPSFRSTSPSFLFSSNFPDGPELRTDCITRLQDAFSLYHVAYASLSEHFPKRSDGPRYLYGIIRLLRTMSSLLVLEASLPLSLITRPLMHENGHAFLALPVQELQELWLPHVDFCTHSTSDCHCNENMEDEKERAVEDESLPTLSACLARRGRFGYKLKKLVLKECRNMEQHEWLALQRLGIDIEVVGRHPTMMT